MVQESTQVELNGTQARVGHHLENYFLLAFCSQHHNSVFIVLDSFMAAASKDSKSSIDL